MRTWLILTHLGATLLVVAACSDSERDDSRGDAGSSDPGSCQVRIEVKDLPTTRTARYEYEYDAKAGTLRADTYQYEIDAEAGTLAVFGEEQDSVRPLYYTLTFDEQGNRTRLEHRDGLLIEYSNEYDGDRLTKVEVVPNGRPGYDASTVSYEYANSTRDTLWTRRQEHVEAASAKDSTWSRTISDGHVSRAEEQRPGMDEPSAVWTSVFDDDVLVNMERDQVFLGPEPTDGKPDIRYSWIYEDGRLSAFEQDGTDHADNPHIDGVADIREEYSPGCDVLLQGFPWVAHIPDENELNPVFGSPEIWRPMAP